MTASGFDAQVISAIMPTFTTCAEIQDGAENNIGTALAFNNWIQDCANDGSGGDLASNTDGVDVSAVGNSTIIVEDAALDDILASQAAGATGLDPIDFDALGGVLSLPSTAGGDPQDFDASFFDDTTFMGAVNPDGSDPWWAGWTVEGSL